MSYRDPTRIDGTAVLQGTNGADVHSFSNARVKNLSLLVASDPGAGPAPASARVDADGDTVIVSFDEDVDGTSIPGAGAFAVTVGGTGVTVSGTGSGDRANDVHIEIGRPIVRGQAVTVSYTRPTSGTAVQDTDGNDAASFAGYPVVSAQAPPPAPLTAAFEDLPGFHDGSTAFTVRLAFSEEFPVTEEAIRAGLTVTGGAPGAVAQAESGKNRRWDITVTPSVAEAVSIALTPKESCGAEGAICTGDGRGLPETVEAEVPGGEPDAGGERKGDLRSGRERHVGYGRDRGRRGPVQPGGEPLRTSERHARHRHCPRRHAPRCGLRERQRLARAPLRIRGHRG